jgi:hypothetical protein
MWQQALLMVVAMANSDGGSVIVLKSIYLHCTFFDMPVDGHTSGLDSTWAGLIWSPNSATVESVLKFRYYF